MKQTVQKSACTAFRCSMVFGIVLLAGVAAAQGAAQIQGPKEKLSYALGVSYGKSLQKQSVELDQALFDQGLKDALSGGKILLSDEEIRAVIAGLQNELKSRQAAAQAERLERNRKDGEAFLAANKVKEGVVTLESGLQYKILKTGDGTKPTATDTVLCNYRGTLIDGTEFDSTYKRNHPATVSINKVIKGWSQALQLMPVGSKWQLFIPPSLAYGERALSASIGPNSTLVFEVELVSIQGAATLSGPADPIKAGLAVKQQQTITGAAPAAALSDIQVSFKLDSRLTGGTYGGDRWVSPPTYSGANAQDTVEARVEGKDAQGRFVRISPTWTPADPDMVTVSPGEGNVVKITVKHAGESSMDVVSDGISKRLSIRARQQGNAIQLEISQK